MIPWVSYASIFQKKKKKSCIFILYKVLCKNFLKYLLLEMKLMGHRICSFSILLDFVELLSNSQ